MLDSEKSETLFEVERIRFLASMSCWDTGPHRGGLVLVVEDLTVPWLELILIARRPVCTQSTTILICTDSKSLCQKLLEALKSRNCANRSLKHQESSPSNGCQVTVTSQGTSLPTQLQKKSPSYHQLREPFHTHQSVRTSGNRLWMAPSLNPGRTAHT